ncbi:MAG: right-handed parallel beta-helix repeat-containing protein [Phycisphaerae bacterium]|nr:right-handed parallel beta-helix repeat-containing protein [Phycisphaerae bacterium]
MVLTQLAGISSPAVASVVYCDGRATGLNDGSDWANAFLCLQDALAAARPGDAIRVAQGTYRPDERFADTRDGARVVASGRRTDSFVLPSGVTLRGGYAGYGAADPDRREIDAYESVLSGDLASDDVPLAGHDWESIRDFVQDKSRKDNSQSVVTVNSAGNSAVLDGFTIADGHAMSEFGIYTLGDYWGAAAHTDGGGAFLLAGSPRFIQCTFQRNTALVARGDAAGGAGVLSINASPIFTKCLFRENFTLSVAGTSLGGALHIIRGDPSLIDCTFVANVACGEFGQYWGGAIANIASSPTIQGCVFQANQAMGSRGGAIHNFDKSSPTLTDCVFEGNLAASGGAIYNNDSSSPTITRCVFTGNGADTGRGGAIHNGDNCVSTTTACLFVGNTAANEGGAVYGSGRPCFLSCLFSANTASNGAAAFIDAPAQAAFLNCTLSSNRALQNGGALYGRQSTTRITNCILWGDVPDEVYLLNGTADITYSNVTGAWAGVGNIHSDPQFLDAAGADAVRGTFDDDLRLSMGSPCLDIGSDAAVPSSMTADLDGKSRIANSRVDLGAYEFNGPFCYYVDAATGDDHNSGWSPKEAFATIQAGINVAPEGYTVAVAPGVYREDIDFGGKAIAVAGWNGAPTLESPDGYAVSFFTAEGSDSVLQNFVITHSDVGVFVVGSSPTIRNVTVAGNDFGIAAYNGANPTIVNCILWDNANGDLHECQAMFSCIQQGLEGQGNISDDPLFADRTGGDYHLLSEKGRYVSTYGLWAFDDRTSPCVDAGDPEADVAAERLPNGGRINMGAFGGTPEASMSEWPLAGDINHDGSIDFRDLAILAEQWLGDVPTQK